MLVDTSVSTANRRLGAEWAGGRYVSHVVWRLGGEDCPCGPPAPSPHTDTQATTVLHPEPQGEQTSPQTSVRQALPCPYSFLSNDA